MRSDTEPNAGNAGLGNLANPRREWLRTRSARKRQRGFTIIEVLTVLTVIAVLARIAVPALHNFMMSNSMVSANNQLVASLNYARNQAVAQRSAVLFCKTANPQATTPTCDTSSTTTYSEGWVVYNSWTDSSGNAHTNIMKVVVPNSVTNITIKGNSGSSIGSEIDFTPLGIPETGLSGSSVTAITGTSYFVLCDSRGWANSGLYARVVLITTTGQITSLAGNDPNQKSASSCSP